MNTAEKGARLERDIIALLESDGWQVMRGTSSKGDVLDYKTDLLASKWTHANKRKLWLVLIQCKVSKR